MVKHMALHINEVIKKKSNIYYPVPIFQGEAALEHSPLNPGTTISKDLDLDI